MRLLINERVHSLMSPNALFWDVVRLETERVVKRCARISLLSKKLILNA